MPLSPDVIETNIEMPPGFNLNSSSDLGSESQSLKDSQMTTIQETMPPPKSGEGPRSTIDTMTITPISTIELGSRDLDNVIPLKEYKFDKSHLVVVKQNPKRQKIDVGGLEKSVTNDFKESNIWNITGQDVARVGVETLVVITGLALASQTSKEAMAKEITQLKQYGAQLQAELAEIVKNAADERQRSLDELKMALEAKHEQETQ